MTFWHNSAHIIIAFGNNNYIYNMTIYSVHWRQNDAMMFDEMMNVSVSSVLGSILLE